ncbi:MAG: hypothetical protein ASARMPREDX12_001157 [Alectoria sarmentosa]|nr:MAG: hypothetical protein ASARMPREDX12_001157 [Alectoria sarmentosa]
MLRQPDSDTSHKQYAHFHCVSALEDDNIFVFIGLDTAPWSGMYRLCICKIAAPPPQFGILDLINGDVYRCVQDEMDAQRKADMKRNYYAQVTEDSAQVMLGLEAGKRLVRGEGRKLAVGVKTVDESLVATWHRMG